MSVIKNTAQIQRSRRNAFSKADTIATNQLYSGLYCHLLAQLCDLEYLLCRDHEFISHDHEKTRRKIIIHGLLVLPQSLHKKTTIFFYCIDEYIDTFSEYQYMSCFLGIHFFHFTEFYLINPMYVSITTKSKRKTIEG